MLESSKESRRVVKNIEKRPLRESPDEKYLSGLSFFKCKETTMPLSLGDRMKYGVIKVDSNSGCYADSIKQ